jgi:hypothetical protein
VLPIILYDSFNLYDGDAWYQQKIIIGEETMENPTTSPTSGKFDPTEIIMIEYNGKNFPHFISQSYLF